VISESANISAKDGGDSEEGSVSCSGGSRNDACFSARFMWRSAENNVADGEMYTYLPPSFKENDQVCSVKPKSDCNPVFGASVGRGSIHLPSGEWVTIGERVKLNGASSAKDGGDKDGELELFIGGKSAWVVKGLVLRQSNLGKMRGLMVQSFFGGKCWYSWSTRISNDLKSQQVRHLDSKQPRIRPFGLLIFPLRFLRTCK
jgi:hypothetical protein